MSTRLDGVDGIRAFACLLVLFHHVALTSDFAAVGPAAHWMIAFAAIGGYGVVIFFVLSGFLLSRPYWAALRTGAEAPSLRTYALRRTARIVPGFYLALVLSLLLSFALGESRADATTFARFAAGLAMSAHLNPHSVFPVEINGPLWSISYEVWSYLLLPLAFALVFAFAAARRSLAFRAALWVAVIVAAVALHYLWVQNWTVTPFPDFSKEKFTLERLGDVWFPRIGFLGMFAIFAIGSLGALVNVELAVRRGWLCDAIAAACVAGILAFLFMVERDPRGRASLFGIFDMPYNGFPLLPLLVGTLLAATPASLRIGRILDAGPMRYLATISFGIYVYQAPIIFVLAYFAFGAGGVATSSVAVLVLLAASLAGSVAAGHLSWFALEKPVIAWAQRWERRPEPPPQVPAEAF